MSLSAVRELINRLNAHAAGLAALGATLDALASGVPLDGALAARFGELLAALGAGEALAGLTADEAAPLVPDIRAQLALSAKLLYPETRATAWSHTDAQLLGEIGAFSRGHATAITRGVAPVLEGLVARLATPGAAFLDIGVGVAGTATAMAQQWPDLRVVGIDIWAPALALARENVERAGLGERIELREQAAEDLDDDQAFDLAWMPIPFMSGRSIPAAAARTLRALRPGGWLILPFIAVEGLDPVATALWRLRQTTFGGPAWSPAEVEHLLRDQGFAGVRTLPRPPGAPMGMSVGRRRPV